MKKYIGVLFISLILSQTALAEWGANCTNNGGIIVTANSYGNDKGGLCNNPSDTTLSNNCNGQSFCRSNNYMNWWSAFTWCESIGGKLASFASICPETQIAVPGTCPNLKGLSNNGTHWVQTSVGWGTTTAVTVSLKTGDIAHDSRCPRSSSNDYFAICEE